MLGASWRPPRFAVNQGNYWHRQERQGRGGFSLAGEARRDKPGGWRVRRWRTRGDRRWRLYIAGRTAPQRRLFLTDPQNGQRPCGKHVMELGTRNAKVRYYWCHCHFMIAGVKTGEVRPGQGDRLTSGRQTARARQRQINTNLMCCSVHNLDNDGVLRIVDASNCGEPR